MRHTALFILLLFLLAGCGQDKPGKQHIKSQTVYVTEYINGKQGTRRIDERTEYDDQGHGLINQHFDENGQIAYGNRSVYNNRGKKIKDVDYLENNKINFITRIKYNELDSIEAYMIYSAGHKLNFTIRSLYNKEGQNYMDLATESDSSVKFWDKYFRDPAGKILKWERYQPDSSIDHTVDYEYDKNGNEIRTISSMGTRTESRYDLSGRKTEELLYNTRDTLENGNIGYLIHLKTFEYDHSGRIIGVKEFNNMSDKPHNPHKRYEYEYQFY